MKTLKFVAFLLHRYYSTGPTSNIAYFQTLLALSMFASFHLFQCMIIFQFNILPQGSKSDFTTWLKTALFVAPIVFFFRIVVSKQEIKTASYSEKSIRRGNRWLLTYIITSFCLVVALAFIFRPSAN
jgi:hypothetical protein